MEANKMNYTTKYCPGCYQDLRPCGCCPPPSPCCHPHHPPRCGCNQNCGDNSILFFAIGYLIAKNCK